MQSFLKIYDIISTFPYVCPSVVNKSIIQTSLSHPVQSSRCLIRLLLQLGFLVQSMCYAPWLFLPKRAELAKLPSL